MKISVQLSIAIGNIRLLEVYIDMFVKGCTNWVYLTILEKDLIDFEWGGNKK